VQANLDVQRLARRSGFAPSLSLEDRKRQRLDLAFTSGDSLILNIRLSRRREVSGEGLLPRVALALYPWPPERPELAECLAGLTQVRTLLVRSRTSTKDHELFSLTPLEPKGYPKNDPGPGTILVDDPASRVRDKLDRAAGLAGQVTGLSIWQGSRAVEDWRVAELTAAYCSRRGLILMEPFPGPQSLIKKAATLAGCGYLSPDLVIPTGASLNQAADRLKKELARGKRRALILVPSSPAGIKALAKVLPKIPVGQIEWIPASGLLQ
jgi:hypothetical protein